MTKDCGIGNSCRHLFIAFLCLIGAGLGGCATTTNMRLVQSHMNTPIKVLLMQSPIKADPRRLETVLAPDIKPKLPIPEGPISRAVKHAQEYALSAMDSALSKQPGLVVVVKPPAGEKPLIDKIQGETFGTALSQLEADRIRSSTGADALLRFHITDYGLTPRSWRDGYIAFEVSSTLALTAAIAYSGAAAAKAAAGAYLAQETAEETAEAYAGFWALDVVSRPVRIEAELIRLHPLAEVWKSSDTGLSDVSLSRLTRKVGSNERDRQLDQATDHAVKDVVSGIYGTLKSIKPGRDRHGPRAGT